MGYRGIDRDITARKQTSEELQCLRKYLSNIIDSMPSILVGIDVDGKVTQWNKNAEESTGITFSNAVGKSITELFSHMEFDLRKIQASIASHKIIQSQRRIYCSETSSRHEDITIYPLDQGIKGAVIRIDDITEKVRMQEMMIQSEKMLSVGGLAAGMAHEINNPLAGIIQTGNVMKNRLQRAIPPNVKAAEEAGTTIQAIHKFMETRGIFRMIDSINVAGRRIASIVENMLSFSRKDEAIRTNQRIEDLIDKTLKLAETDYDLKKHYDFKLVEIQREYAKNLPSISCEAGKIQQVILNILRNGAQAMQDDKTKDPQFIVRAYLEEDRNMICIEIEDNGPGIAENIRKRLFEPFFTTKPVGVGTGLGLSVSYFIITENHNGEMEVESQLGFGAKFIIRLPLGHSKAILDSRR